ncbi:MAG: hypothetical protein JXR40_09995, partial [Pontiellaceae bacterium]|nr:hypothetical protein [Pontiellaceae bacterium]
VGGVFGLVGAPVVFHAPEFGLEQRVDPPHEGVELGDPVEFDEAVGQLLRLFIIGNNGARMLRLRMP